MSTLNATVLNLVENELQQKEYQEAQRVLTCPDKLLEVEDLGMELIHSIGKYGIQDYDSLDINSPLETCANMLTYIANNFNPRLSILALLEQAEIFALSYKLSYFVVPIGCSLLRMIETLQESKIVNSFEWALSTLNGFVNKNFQTKWNSDVKHMSENLSSHMNCCRILCELYEFLNEGLGMERQFKQLQEDRIKDPSAEKIEERRARLRKCNAAVDTVYRYAFEMLAEPLVFVNVCKTEVRSICHENQSRFEELQEDHLRRISPEKVEELKTQLKKSNADQDVTSCGLGMLSERLVFASVHNSKEMNVCCENEQVSSLVSRILSIIQKVYASRNTIKMLDIDNLLEEKFSVLSQGSMCPWDMIPGDEVAVSQTAIAHFIYLIYIAGFSEGYIWELKAFSSENRLQQCLELSNALFGDCPDSPNASTLCKKGIALVNKALEWMSDANPKDTEVEKEFPHLLEFMEKLCILLIQCADKDTRRQSILLMRKLTCQFNPKWRSKVIHWVLSTSNHDSLKGYYITILKDSVHVALEEKDVQMKEEFFGEKLESFLYKICNLEHSDSDALNSCYQNHNEGLLGRTDSVISVLNFFLYLCMRDGKNNETGFRIAMDRIRKEYITPLKGLVEVSLQKYNLRRTMVYQGRLDEEDEQDSVTSAIIDGVEVFSPNMSVPEKLEVIQSAIVTFQFIQDRLVLLEEWYQDKCK